MTIDKNALTEAWNGINAAMEHAKAEFAAVFETLNAKLNQTPPTPPPVPTRPFIKFAAHRYLTTGPVVEAATFHDVQDWSGLNAAPWPKDAEIYLYATHVRCLKDPDGFRQYVRPSVWVPSSLATRTDDGKPVFRSINGGDDLLNLADAGVRAEMVRGAVTKVLARGAAGLYADEADQQWDWPWKVPGIKQFPTMSDWRQALWSLYTELATALHAKGKKLWINLGADYDVENPWQRDLINAVDGINIEFFIGRDGVGQPTATKIDWMRQVEFVRQVETYTGKAVHVHVSSASQRVVDFAFGSWLLATSGYGSFTASLNYNGAILMPSAGLLEAARKLGVPKGPYRAIGDGLQIRDFQNGSLYVNRSTTQTVRGLQPLSAGVELW